MLFYQFLILSCNLLFFNTKFSPEDFILYRFVLNEKEIFYENVTMYMGQAINICLGLLWDIFVHLHFLKIALIRFSTKINNYCQKLLKKDRYFTCCDMMFSAFYCHLCCQNCNYFDINSFINKPIFTECCTRVVFIGFIFKIITM